MEKRDLRLAVRGRPGLLVLGLAAELSEPQADVETLALPLMVRDGGFLLAVPYGAFDQQVLLDGLAEDADGEVGPNKLFESGLTAEAEDGSVQDLQKNCKFYVVDLKDEMLIFLRDYNPEADSMDVIVPFSAEDPYALPSLDGVIEKVRDWAASAHQGPRAAFYSAREEPDPMANGGPPKKAPARRVTTAALMDRVEALTAQVQLLSGQNAPKAPATPVAAASHAVEPYGGFVLPTPKMPRLSDAMSRNVGGDALAKAAALLSPPPRQRSGVPKASPVVPKPGPAMFEDEPYHLLRPASGPYAHGYQPAEFGFDCACCALDSWWRGSPFGFWFFYFLFELYQHTWIASQGETDGRPVSRVIYLFPNPSMVAPKTEEDIQKNPPSLADYLERHGGFRSQRTLGIILWMLSYAVDAGARGEDRLMKEHLALAVASIEQCAVDQGEWGLGYLLSLSADPPLQLFQDRHQTVAMHQKSFGGLVPPQWSTVAVAFLKEMEVLNTKKQDLSKKNRTAQEDAEDPDASPRRRPRFPRKPKAKPKADGA